METKTVNVMEENWDYLIVLDACRYDYFRDIYQNYFSGNLESRLSVGSSTMEWCLNSFQKMYPEVVYVSGNPYINSKAMICGFDARKRFYKIVDVWDFGWNKTSGTVHPEKISECTLDASKKFSEKRFILHYLQPHAPYISTKIRTKGFPTPNVNSKNVLTGIQNSAGNRVVERFVNPLAAVLSKLGVVKTSWKLWELLRLQPASPMDAVRRVYGTEGLKEAYKENLRIVLLSVAGLCAKLLQHDLSRNIVITADHGELLGENGLYGHFKKSKNPLLLTVPWFKVKKAKKLTQLPEIAEYCLKSRLKERIKKLKATTPTI